jgi:hypothetical protein
LLRLLSRHIRAAISEPSTTQIHSVRTVLSKITIPKPAPTSTRKQLMQTNAPISRKTSQSRRPKRHGAAERPRSRACHQSQSNGPRDLSSRLHRWMNCLFTRIDNELHSTRFLRNENPPETHPLEHLHDSTPTEATIGRQDRQPSIKPRWENGDRFQIPS